MNEKEIQVPGFRGAVLLLWPAAFPSPQSKMIDDHFGAFISFFLSSWRVFWAR